MEFDEDGASSLLPWPGLSVWELMRWGPVCRMSPADRGVGSVEMDGVYSGWGGRLVTSTGYQSMVVKALLSKCIVCYLFLKKQLLLCFCSTFPLGSSITGRTLWFPGLGGTLLFLQ